MDHIYDSFRNNDFISSIAANERWTVSTAQKMPIDMYIFINRGIVSGAIYNNELSLVSLDALHNAIPDAAVYTYYMDALIDHFVVLDIEPKCPEDIKKQLLSMGCLYMETSMSGKGIHMVFKVPTAILDKYPNAKEKTALKEEHGYYEILLNHYITFTGNQIDSATIADHDHEFDNLFENLAKVQKIVSKTDITVEELPEVKTKNAKRIILVLTNCGQKYKKKPEDFFNDMSKYEFSYTAYLQHQLQHILDVPGVKAEHTYTDSEKAWFLYQVTSQLLPQRPKHEEKRNGVPWLLYLAFEVLAKADNDTRKDPAV